MAGSRYATKHVAISGDTVSSEKGIHFVTDVRVVAAKELVRSFSGEHHLHSLQTRMLGEQHERQCRRIRDRIIIKEAPVVEARSEILSGYPAHV